MNYNQFSNLSCYEEFEILVALTGISKIDILKEIGHKVDNYYFFISEDGIFNWYNLNGNHVDNPGILREIKSTYISKNIIKCVIPNSVTFIGDSAFTCCRSLTSITIPNSVTHICYGAFADCISLKEIIIPNSVTLIGDGAFTYCESLTSITIPNNVTNISQWAFWGCYSLEEITIPNSVTSIGNDAFWDCESLKEVFIPDSVTGIGDNTFLYCKSLKEVIFKGKNLDEVKQMKYYPFGIEDENVFKFS